MMSQNQDRIAIEEIAVAATPHSVLFFADCLELDESSVQQNDSSNLTA